MDDVAGLGRDDAVTGARVILPGVAGLLGMLLAISLWHLWDDHRLVDAIRAAQLANQAAQAQQIQQFQQQQKATP